MSVHCGLAFTLSAKQSLNKNHSCRAVNRQGIGNLTAEKQAPSALQYLAEFTKSVGLERKAGGEAARRRSQKELLNRVIAAYNKTVSVKRYRVEGERKRLIFNLMRVRQDFLTLIARHYDKFGHAVSGSGHCKKTESVESVDWDIFMFFLTSALTQNRP